MILTHVINHLKGYKTGLAQNFTKLIDIMTSKKEWYDSQVAKVANLLDPDYGFLAPALVFRAESALQLAPQAPIF